MEYMDIFNDDAFSLISMTAAISEIDHVPGRAGEMAFAGNGEGIATTTASFERKGESLTLVQSSPRGGPAPKETQEKGTLRSVSIPQIKLEDTIGAHQVQGIREFGTTNALRSVQSVVNGQLSKMSKRFDLTLEHLRLGALQGKVYDADGATVLADLFEIFGVKNSLDASGPEEFDFDLAGDATEPVDIRLVCQDIVRYVTRKAKMIVPQGAQIWAFCGDNFFDGLITRDDVKAVYNNTADQERRLGANYAFGRFEFGGIVFENYRGTDDQSTVGIPTGEARFFITGVPGLYAEYFAPADFMETVNTIGLPRYAKIAPDEKFNRFVELHAQMNPLPVCLRPQTLVKGLM